MLLPDLGMLTGPTATVQFDRSSRFKYLPAYLFAWSFTAINPNVQLSSDAT